MQVYFDASLQSHEMTKIKVNEVKPINVNIDADTNPNHRHKLYTMKAYSQVCYDNKYNPLYLPHFKIKINDRIMST